MSTYTTVGSGPCDTCRDEVDVLYRLVDDRNGANVCSDCRPDYLSDAERVGTLGIDVSHGCHHNAEWGHVRDFVVEVADTERRQNPEDPVYGTMPYPARVEEGDDATGGYTVVTYPDGSRLEWYFDRDGYAEAMSVYGPGKVAPLQVFR